MDNVPNEPTAASDTDHGGEPRLVPVRVVTAASLFDGHDAAINVMRRILQSLGCEVIHLGHNRSVDEIVWAVVQEDADAVAVSSYQGGHNEYFRYLRDRLVDRGAGHVRIFGGGGGVILPKEIDALEAYGIERIYSPEDGRTLGLEGMLRDVMVRTRSGSVQDECAGRGLLAGLDSLDAGLARIAEEGFSGGNSLLLGRLISLVENRSLLTPDLSAGIDAVLERGRAMETPVIGMTGTGGAGKSSLTDELLLRFRRQFPERRIGVISVDPTKRRTGGALLGDRIRMNAIYDGGVYLRSLATRGSGAELSSATADTVALLKAAGCHLIVVETSGIGQGDSAVVDLVDVPVYVMTPEYGAPSQLEKIDMIDFARAVVINKYDRAGAEDSVRDVRRQYRRSHGLFHAPGDEELPVFGTVASRFADDGVDALLAHLVRELAAKWSGWGRPVLDASPVAPVSSDREALIPGARVRYLADIAESVRSYHRTSELEAALLERRQHLVGAATELGDAGAVASLDEARSALEAKLPAAAMERVDGWAAERARWTADEFVYTVRGREIRQPLFTESLAGSRIPRVAVPRYSGHGDLHRWLRREGLPGQFPYTASLYPLRRKGEDPKRQFAGEGPPARTNARFHYLSKGDEAKRLSTAFDSVTLYGEDPDPRPDIYGKVGESGVSICTLDDMKTLYGGFDLIAPSTSVSMTINGPAPMLLAMFLNTAIDQQVSVREEAAGAPLAAAERAAVADEVLRVVRGTVQADILKEDQAQNTCIFSTEFALRMMGDMQEYFVEKGVRNYYAVSISGYHIAEAGANPISQLAFTLANGFTFVEYYLARGLDIDSFAPNLSFFFSNGLDPEYTVIGRVARRIWAIAMRDRYGANARSQMLKYHVQTSGRSLHAQEMDFNDIRTTLQALLALNDNCNSLHTNAYDEAVTTPTEESVRRAMAVQMIVTKELGLYKNENPLQGAFVVDELTDLVEEAVLREFERISQRGGVLGAMERQYQRNKIQEESLLYEQRKHDGSLPIIGVNTYLNPAVADGGVMLTGDIEVRRATGEEKDQRIDELRAFQSANADAAGPALARLQEVATSGGNIFAELMRTVRVASLGQISSALYEVGGQYRRSM